MNLLDWLKLKMFGENVEPLQLSFDAGEMQNGTVTLKKFGSFL